MPEILIISAPRAVRPTHCFGQPKAAILLIYHTPLQHVSYLLLQTYLPILLTAIHPIFQSSKSIPMKRKIVVFSGGSAANSLVDVFDEVIEKNNCTLTYIIPISDNGGSSSELIRVFGGPGIGDVRSMNALPIVPKCCFLFAITFGILLISKSC